MMLVTCMTLQLGGGLPLWSGEGTGCVCRCWCRLEQ